MPADHFISSQKLITSQQQFTEIRHALTIALLFVECVDLGHIFFFTEFRGHVARPQPLFFSAGDIVLHVFRRILINADTMRLH